MNTFVLRMSLKGNWGLFQMREVSMGGYYTYPKCSCPNCTGIPHAKYNLMTGMTWVAVYVNRDRNNVLAWAKAMSNITVTDEKGTPIDL